MPTVSTLLDLPDADLAAKIGMPAVIDFKILPDMGRMNGQWRSAARTGYSLAPTRAANARRRSIP
jgi:hypothetical protein